MLKRLITNKWMQKLIDHLIGIAMSRLTESQKQLIKNKLSLHQKELLKKLTKNQKYNVGSHIKEIKYKLLELGFVERALEDLRRLASDNSNPLAQREAQWELALWHADQHTLEDAHVAQSYLIEALKDENSKLRIQQGAILQAEILASLGNKQEARGLLSNILLSQRQGDLLLAAANLEEDVNSKLYWINELMKLHGLAEVVLESTLPSYKAPYDCLKTKASQNAGDRGEAPLVSVIMPVYNSASVIETALKSLLTQTWNNLELIIVDDCSSDNTVSIVKEYMKKDNRIKLICAESNSGTYVARNIGLKAATGEFVTCHDADDWSHAEKIERQVVHLMRNPRIIANLTEQSRMTNDLLFYRRKQQRGYLSQNLSSLMFRREQVIDKVGYWDSVRFGGDGEFLRRLKKVFGEKAVECLHLGPLSFTRVSDSSLTENGPFGYHGYFYGARREYVEAFSYYHAHQTSLYYEFPQGNRPFAIPQPMYPKSKLPGVRHFDVIIASDLRLTGGTTSSNVEEIKAQRQAGLKTGLIQMSRYQGSGARQINSKIRELIDGDQVQMLVFGEKVECDVLIIRHPPVLQELQLYIPEVKAKRICVIVNQTPKVDYGENGAIAYDIVRCQENLYRYFGQTGVWYPIGPLVRRTLEEYHTKELESIQLSKEDWVNIINLDEWKREKKVRHDKKIRIGRHSRDQYVKWPSDPDEILQIYPDSDPYEVHVLGGANIPKSILGSLPKNWRVYEFGEMHPADFLSRLDFFVYYIHPECVEAFGRVIIEAMAAGVPVIIPPDYKGLFKDAAIYATPEEVKSKLRIIIENDEIKKNQVLKAYTYLEDFFSYNAHIRRLIVRGGDCGAS